MYYPLILFILINAGVSIGICRSKLTESFRNKIKGKSEFFGSWIGCVMCFAFSSSILVYWYVYGGLNENTIGFMFIGSFTSHFLNKISTIVIIGG